MSINCNTADVGLTESKFESVFSSDGIEHRHSGLQNLRSNSVTRKESDGICVFLGYYHAHCSTRSRSTGYLNECRCASQYDRAAKNSKLHSKNQTVGRCNKELDEPCYFLLVAECRTLPHILCLIESLTRLEYLAVAVLELQLWLWCSGNLDLGSKITTKYNVHLYNSTYTEVSRRHDIFIRGTRRDGQFKRRREQKKLTQPTSWSTIVAVVATEGDLSAVLSNSAILEVV